jgi:hypothetical protein
MIETGARTRDTWSDFFWSVICGSEPIGWISLAIMALSALAAWSR